MIPPRLRWLEASDEGRRWLSAVPGLVAACAERWGLDLGEPYADGHVSLTAPATTADGRAAVLKVQFPHRESEHEADALARWDGDGAVHLLAHDTARHALLIERCTPGTHLAGEGGDAALTVFAELLPRLWKPAGQPFTPLADEAARWAADLPRRWEAAGTPFEQQLLDAAVEALVHLASSQGEQVLLHQDLHGDNVLRAERESWLAIDPKPLTGEREAGLAPIVRSYELGHSRPDVLHRLERLTSELGLDRERARGWALGQTLAWAFDGTAVRANHVETARWLTDG